MASNKNPFLDDLFPDPMRARKARIFKGYEKVSNTAAFRFSALSSKVKAEGVVDKRAEVMFRFGQANIKSYLHTIKAADYIARNGDIELIDQNGNSLQGKAEYRKVLYEWKLLSEMGDGTSKRGHARRVILSMPAGTDEEKFKTACGQWAKDMLTDMIICWLSICPEMIKKLLSLTVTFFFVQKTERAKGFILQTTSWRQCVSISLLASSSAASRPMRPEGGQEERRSREFLKQNIMF